MSRLSTSFQKRQRELAKREKRKHRDEKREDRKVQSAESGGAPIEVIDPADLGLPALDSIRSGESASYRYPVQVLAGQGRGRAVGGRSNYIRMLISEYSFAGVLY